MKTQKGFTLIELVMVIVILGILAAVAIPKFADLTSRAETSAEEGIIGGLRSALSVYASDQVSSGAAQSLWYPKNPFDAVQDYPTSLDTLVQTKPDFAGTPADRNIWRADGAPNEAVTVIWHSWKDGITMHSWRYDTLDGTLSLDSLFSG